MVATLEGIAPSLSTFQEWAAESRRGRKTVEDDSRFRRLATTLTEENIDPAHHMLMDDYKSSDEGLSTRLPRRLLTPDQKHSKLITSLTLLGADQMVFLNLS